MNKVLLVVAALFSFNTLADTCTEIAKYDELMSQIYVVCPDLPNINDDDLGTIVYTIFKENEFTPDEYTIDFVTSKQFLTQESLTKENHVGFYYTHDNGLIIWPKNQDKIRHVQLRI
ncbi:hypothetical protein [Simiduia aestuariiviva]|uniref:Uncharacterized protein n=1 Tax=Simiduia aestuariiviva TaxID=1510459 RepID=A0A839UXY5_9GAMM|nr:hypothetical protein [Simiduia aestuariiviva]MBB3170217.1 hypothetical protein [Simiduia aestuariiviva]